MNNDTKIILGIFAGLAAGAALGLLLAPERKKKQLNGHEVSRAKRAHQSEDHTKAQLQHLENIKDRLMNTFNEDFNDHVEHV
ncbi:YtxH domain-containing protein [Pedobacter gandavensis]|uniref:YtxH domain-containing protein n=1 Tax=Pedobacter gandavensis TaxID=2679963 RepID=A0ABR6ERC0_9SPHI|nr:YtxH domain-containing protein [Pedobacter gandavensis]MBB2147798.1 YtxH domain-containing protein [Pedobacter gandavensis]